MSMTKKDYEMLARGLEIARPSRHVVPNPIEAQGQKIVDVYCYGRDNAWDNTCKTLAEMLELHDKRFKRRRFLELCGVHTETCPKCGSNQLSHVYLGSTETHCDTCGLQWPSGVTD